MAAIPEIIFDTFKSEVLQSTVPVLVDLYAPWCGPCQLMSVVLERIAPQFSGRAKVVKINTDNEPELAAAFRVSSIPAVVLVRGGIIVDGFVGLPPAKAILEMIDKATAPLSSATR